MQTLIVALLVPACAAYAAWTLMPAAARRGLAVQLLRIRPSGIGTAALQKAALPASSCGCNGCDRAPRTSAVAKAGGQTLHFHPRAKS